ncbi:MAG: zinc-dependent peptidase [bacterium]|nr:zinc-dependent peptidase [bacterium]
MFGLRRRRRARLRATPVPDAWREIIARNVAIHRRLSAEDQRELLGHVQVFLAEKRFEGCGGLELSDEIRVTIAAQACVLLLHRETDYYPECSSILVYPHAYVAPVLELGPDGIVHEGASARLGESWVRGVVVLSWDDVLAGAADVHDGHNVVLHEFAHQLDQEDGAGDGAPPLPRRSMYVAWARVLSAEYDALRADAAAGRVSVLDHYGATNPAEFFAVASECFFEKSRQLRAKHPELYEELRVFYAQDPAAFAGAD